MITVRPRVLIGDYCRTERRMQDVVRVCRTTERHLRRIARYGKLKIAVYEDLPGQYVRLPSVTAGTYKRGRK